MGIVWEFAFGEILNAHLVMDLVHFTDEGNELGQKEVLHGQKPQHGS